jgi:hypothetical protein
MQQRLNAPRQQTLDRNHRNLTAGNHCNIVQYDLSKSVDVVENTRSIVRTFKRIDVRIRKTIATKYGRRRRNRVQQLLRHHSKLSIQKAKDERTAIAFEKLTPLAGCINAATTKEVVEQVKWMVNCRGQTIDYLQIPVARRANSPVIYL